VHFIDCFPVAMGQLDFSTMDNDAQVLKTAVTFHCTTFEIFLPERD
jgi:hypothetical protein